MADQTEEPKRRGRPRLADEERKRHTMTFRMRTDLRAAVEELAQDKGRSISEQIEYYVETGVSAEIENLYKYSFGPLSDVLKRCAVPPAKSKAHSNLNKLPTDNQKYKTRVSDEQHEDALEMAHILFEAAKKGTIEALGIALGEHVVEDMLDHEAEGRRRDLALLSSIAENRGRGHLMEEVDRLKAEIAALKSEAMAPGDGLSHRVPVERAILEQGNTDFSLAALVALIGRFTARSPNLSPLWSSSWPRAFADLPADTRSALIGALKDEASSVYETLMRPPSRTRFEESPIRPSVQDVARGIQLSALRRLQNALLPHREEDDFHDDEEPSVSGRA